MNASGEPLGGDGKAVRPARSPDLDALRDEVRLLRDAVEGNPSFVAESTLREVAMRLKGSAERQGRALELQAEAVRELSTALREQGEAIAQLILPATVDDIVRSRKPQ